MPTYAYEALNAAGKPQKGSVEASSVTCPPWLDVGCSINSDRLYLLQDVQL